MEQAIRHAQGDLMSATKARSRTRVGPMHRQPAAAPSSGLTRPNSLAEVALQPSLSPAQRLSNARLIRLGDVMARVGMRRTTVYGLIKAGKFPRPVKLGSASVWVDAEITDWIASLVASRDEDV
jgi:prophage regulatory protein